MGLRQPRPTARRLPSVYGTAISFDASSSQTVYGYYVTDGTDLIWAERFSSSQALANGDSLSITPKLTGKSAN